MMLSAITTVTALSLIFVVVPVLGGRQYNTLHDGNFPMIITPTSLFARNRRNLKANLLSATDIYSTSLVSSSSRFSKILARNEGQSRSSRSNNNRKRERNEASMTEANADQEVDLRPRYTYDDLGPIGKAIAGCTEVIFATAFEYCSGFAQGFCFGSLVGIPGFLFRPMEKNVRQALQVEMTSRLTRMNTRSMSWAKNFGSISAAFGGLSVAVKVLRNGEDDAWTQIISSAAAGAFFARKEGPQAMLRGALLYGGLIYFTSGSSMKEPKYIEHPVAM